MTSSERTELAAKLCRYCRAGRRLKCDVYGWIHPGGLAIFDYCEAAAIHDHYSQQQKDEPAETKP